MSRKSLSLILSALACLFMSACSASSAPRQIASYPANAPRSISPPQAMVYNASLELEVYDPEASAQQAARIASSYGGYLVSSYSGYQGGRGVACLTLAVPRRSFEAVRLSLLSLGDLVSEDLSGQPETTDYPEAALSHITLTLHQAPTYWSPPPRSYAGGWNPAQTLEHALRVFLSLFKFIADALIWIVVVGGPFALMTWGAWALVRRKR